MNKNHWYDGKFFDLFIAPNQDRAFSIVRELVMDGSSVLDVGCGTGRLAFQLSDKCSAIDGIDLSRRNVQTAISRLTKEHGGGITFRHADAFEFLSSHRNRYDYAVLSYVIHEVEERARGELLSALSAAADKVILVDYMVPQPGNMQKAFDRLVELAAGREHYRNFRSFIDGGGLSGLIRKAGLNMVGQPIRVGSSGEILVVSVSSSVRG